MTQGAPSPFSPPGESGWVAPPGPPVSGAPQSAIPEPAWLGGAPLGGAEPPFVETAPAPNRDVVTRWVAGVLGVVAGPVIVASSWMTWVTADIRAIGIRNGSGWHNVAGNVSLGPAVAAAGVAVSLGAALTAADVARRFALVLMAVGTVASAGLVAWEIIDISTPGPGVVTSIGSGIWAMLGGTVVAVVVLVLAALGRRAPAEAA